MLWSEGYWVLKAKKISCMYLQLRSLKKFFLSSCSKYRLFWGFILQVYLIFLWIIIFMYYEYKDFFKGETYGCHSKYCPNVLQHCKSESQTAFWIFFYSENKLTICDCANLKSTWANLCYYKLLSIFLF